MSKPSNHSIVVQDKEISAVLQSSSNKRAEMLFDASRSSGTNRDAFVAALIGRLLLEHDRRRLDRGDA